MSKPRPIHRIHREIRSTPDEAEPSFSYEREQETYLQNQKEADVEDEFHRRSSHPRNKNNGERGFSSNKYHNSGTSLWRPTASSAASDNEDAAADRAPSFTSVQIETVKGQQQRQVSALSSSLRSTNSETGSSRDSVRGNDNGSGTGAHQHEAFAAATDAGARLSLSNNSDRSYSNGGFQQQQQEEEQFDSQRSLLLQREARDKAKKDKDISKQRAADRRLKLSSRDSENGLDIGHIVDENNNGSGGANNDSLDPFGHSRHTSVDSSFNESRDSSNDNYYRNNHDCQKEIDAQKVKDSKINVLLDQCEQVNFLRSKKKLILKNLNLNASDIPCKDICAPTNLGKMLHKLSLAGNPRLGEVPNQLVVSLPNLKHLDISQCQLHQLPTAWKLPLLKQLNISHNRLTDFPEESMLEGLPELQELNMYGNKVTEIIVPPNPGLLSKLETLDLGYNDLAYLPYEMDQWKALRTLKVMNNFLEKVPMRVCDMDLKVMDVTSNPVVQPPIETCERGIASMKRYYHCIRMEEQSKKKAVKDSQKRATLKTTTKKKSKKQNSIAEASKEALGFLNKMVKISVPSSSSSSSSRGNKAASTPASVQSLPGDFHRAKPLFNPSTSPIRSISLNTPGSSPTTSLKATTSRISVELGPSVPLQTTDSELPAAAKVNITSSDTTVNDTLKVIFVGMAMVGKTSMIKRLIEGETAHVPTHDERTVGVDIYEWDPVKDRRFENIDSRIQVPDQLLTKKDVNVKFSVWDFAGQHVYHATHELFFSRRSLYVLVWDMGATNPATMKRESTETYEAESGAFKLTYDSSDEDEDDDTERANMNNVVFNDDGEELLRGCLADEKEARRADRALERDIDEKIQFWVDCIQSSAPGAAILPVASFSDYFQGGSNGGETEARRRCVMLKQRLLLHEKRRIEGVEKRLKKYKEENRADDPAAVRLRQLLCSFSRPKLIFGTPGENADDCPVVQVSGTRYLGFELLTQKIVGVATGQDFSGWRYPIFHGHVGARIPRMRLQVRDCVRSMRDRFKVVEWGYFVQQLHRRCGDDELISSVEDISDALHFLTDIGELSYFGAVMKGKKVPEEQQQQFNERQSQKVRAFASSKKEEAAEENANVDPNTVEDDDVDFQTDRLSMDGTSITASSTDGSLTTVEDYMSSGLSQFIFLNPRWLVAAVACILRHDLDRELKETKRLRAGALDNSNKKIMDTVSSSLVIPRAEQATPSTLEHLHNTTASFYKAHLNCPVITADDACLLWQSKRITKKAAERAQEYSNNMTVTPFEFLQLLLIRFGVFVPIDLSIEKALLGGTEYSYGEGGITKPTASDTVQRASPNSEKAATAVTTPKFIGVESLTREETTALRAKFFFLPSLLGPGEATEAWTYKSTDSWKTCLCNSILFPDGVPPGLMERITAGVLSSIYSVASHKEQTVGESDPGYNHSVVPNYTAATLEGRLHVKEILCWRTAFFIKLGTRVPGTGGEVSVARYKESISEIFVHLADRESNLCVGSDAMGVGMRRLVISAKGQVGDCGRKIWKGGYLLVIKCICRVMHSYGGLEFEKEAFCPECLAKKAVSEASCWDMTVLRCAMLNGESTLRCRHGHCVDTRLVAGPIIDTQRHTKNSATKTTNMTEETKQNETGVPVQDLLQAVVVVGLWDGKACKVVRVGSGFVVDKKRGLIVTAAHTLVNIWGDKKYPFGENYYGLRQGKVVIGVIPRDADDNVAVFRYFAKIVAKDDSMDQGECHLDACVLRITTRMEKDVADGNGEGCGVQPERLLLNNPDALKKEKLQALKITEKCELDEQVRVIGYNQGGEGLLGPGQRLNRYVDFARGYVCKKFGTAVDNNESNNDGAGAPVADGPTGVLAAMTTASVARSDRFLPRKEVVVICPTIGGHSGGPCVNQAGQVIGLLSRADPTESQRCYISPATEWKSLIKKAKSTL